MVNIESFSKFLLLSLTVLATSCTPAWGQTLREEVALFDKPDGKPAATKLKAGSPVKTLKRQGFWVEVDTEGKVGWLKVSQIKFAGATGGSTAIDTGRLGTGNIVASSAARGLSAKDLLSGAPKPEEVAKMAAFAPTPAALLTFQAQGGIKPVEQKISLRVVERPPNPDILGRNGLAAPGRENLNAPPAGKKKDDDW
ncbi:MAG: hypothetical protein EXR78_09320 [Deltaproteobacteria bacterium]|nr:hypothetical protein [Deltaproteobacteria bacterium]